LPPATGTWAIDDCPLEVTAILVRATVVIGLVRLSIAASHAWTARVDAEPVAEHRPITGCFGRPDPPRIGGIRYEPEGLLEVDIPQRR
jgi:hypothetical protein